MMVLGRSACRALVVVVVVGGGGGGGGGGKQSDYPLCDRSIS